MAKNAHRKSNTLASSMGWDRDPPPWVNWVAVGTREHHDSGSPGLGRVALGLLCSLHVPSGWLEPELEIFKGSALNECSLGKASIK